MTENPLAIRNDTNFPGKENNSNDWFYKMNRLERCLRDFETRLTELERREITSKKIGNEILAVELKNARNVSKNWQQI